MKKLIHWDDNYIADLTPEELEKEVKISEMVSGFLNHYFEDFYFRNIYII